MSTAVANRTGGFVLGDIHVCLQLPRNTVWLVTSGMVGLRLL